MSDLTSPDRIQFIQNVMLSTYVHQEEWIIAELKEFQDVDTDVQALKSLEDGGWEITSFTENQSTDFDGLKLVNEADNTAVIGFELR